MTFVDVDAAFDCNCNGGSDGTLNDITTCMTDENESTNCLEIKAAQGLKIQTNHLPEVMSSVSLRLINESVMSQGTLRVSPYDTSSEILDTNGVTTPEISGAESNDISLGSSFLDDLEAAVNPAKIRVWENGSGAKIKMAEVDIEFTIATIDLIAESRDDDDNLVVSCGVNLLRRTGSFPYTYTQIDNATTHATLGTHTFQYEDDGAFYRIFYLKELSPDQWDMSDEVQGA